MVRLKKSGTWAFDVERDYQDDPWDRLSHATNLFALIELMQSLPSLFLTLHTHTHFLSPIRAYPIVHALTHTPARTPGSEHTHLHAHLEANTHTFPGRMQLHNLEKRPGHKKYYIRSNFSKKIKPESKLKQKSVEA